MFLQPLSLEISKLRVTVYLPSSSIFATMAPHLTLAELDFLQVKQKAGKTPLCLLRWEALWVGRGIGQRSMGRSEEGRVYREEGRGSHGRWTRGGGGRELEKTSSNCTFSTKPTVASQLRHSCVTVASQLRHSCVIAFVVYFRFRDVED